jgi:GH25 family lysozyme M1 (1,4-beta-N-acetylmuramidase)
MILKKESIFKKIGWIFAAVYTILACFVLLRAIPACIAEDESRQLQAVKATSLTADVPSGPVYECVSDISSKSVHITASSVKNDITVNLVDDSTGAAASGVLFSVNITNSAGAVSTYTSADSSSGYIYVNNVAAGDYTVTLITPGGCTVSTASVTVNVKDQSVYVAKKTVTAKKYTAKVAAADPQAKAQVLPTVVLTNTVDFVESSKTLVSAAHTEYVQIDKSQVKVPETTTSSSVSTTSTSAASTVLLTLADGTEVYVKNADGTYTQGTASDYDSGAALYIKQQTADEYKYTGWQTMDGKTYYYDKYGNKVTGSQVINGAKYYFGSDGALAAGYGSRGIDVSKWQGTINWNTIKASGYSFVIIRAGIEWLGECYYDPNCETNIRGALSAGLTVGLYWFDGARNESEAVNEASYCVNLAKKYNIQYPIFIDSERAGDTTQSSSPVDYVSNAQRTADVRAFCETIRNSGYRAGVYASTYWYKDHLIASQLTQYYIWVADYRGSFDKIREGYSGHVDMWQYSSKAVNGYSVGVSSAGLDLDISYINL